MAHAALIDVRPSEEPDVRARIASLGLGAMWGRHTACDMLRAAGFTGIRMRQLPHDFQNSYFIASKQPLASRKNVRAAATAGQSRAVGDEHPLKVGTV